MHGPASVSVASTIWTGVFWVLVVLAIGAFSYLVARLVTDRRDSVAPAVEAAAANPRTILDERLARGEIDVDDYKNRLAALGD